MISSLNLLGFRALGPRAASSPRLREGESFGAGHFDFLEGMVGFDLFFHLGFDLLEIFGRDAVGQLDVVVEAVLDRWSGGKLRFRPDLQNGGGENVRGGMAEPLQVGHLGALLGCFAFVGHGFARFFAALRMPARGG